MELKKENLSFVIKEKGKSDIIFLMDLPILGYQKDVLENVSFYYDFKDFSIDLEDEVLSKIETSGEEETVFVVLYDDKTLYECDLEQKLCINDAEEKDTSLKLYYFFDKYIKMINNKILEEHKALILSTVK